MSYDASERALRTALDAAGVKFPNFFYVSGDERDGCYGNNRSAQYIGTAHDFSDLIVSIGIYMDDVLFDDHLKAEVRDEPEEGVFILLTPERK